MALNRQILWLLAPVIAFSFFFEPAYADVDFFRDESYDIPEERLPFQLHLNATREGLQGDEVSLIQLELYENRTNGKIMNVSLVVTLTDLRNNERMMTDLFYAQNGTIAFLLAHNAADGAGIEVGNGYREQFLSAWVAYAPASGTSDIVTISSPQIQENGLYQLTVELLTIDDIRRIVRLGSVLAVNFVLDTSEDASMQFTVVPEFPLGSLVLFAGILTVTTAATRIHFLRSKVIK